jgi:hypothetical protein
MHNSTLIFMYCGYSCCVLHILLNQMAAFVFKSFSLVFLNWLYVFAYLAFTILMCDIPCTFLYYCNNFTNTRTIVNVLVKLLQSYKNVHGMSHIKTQYTLHIL